MGRGRTATLQGKGRGRGQPRRQPRRGHPAHRVRILGPVGTDLTRTRLPRSSVHSREGDRAAAVLRAPRQSVTRTQAPMARREVAATVVAAPRRSRQCRGRDLPRRWVLAAAHRQRARPRSRCQRPCGETRRNTRRPMAGPPRVGPATSKMICGRTCSGCLIERRPQQLLRWPRPAEISRVTGRR